MYANTHNSPAVRVLGEAEIDAVAGGPIPLVVAIIIAAPTVVAAAYTVGQAIGSALAHEEIANGA